MASPTAGGCPGPLSSGPWASLGWGVSTWNHQTVMESRPLALVGIASIAQPWKGEGAHEGKSFSIPRRSMDRPWGQGVLCLLSGSQRRFQTLSLTGKPLPRLSHLRPQPWCFPNKEASHLLGSFPCHPLSYIHPLHQSHLLHLPSS